MYMNTIYSDGGLLWSQKSKIRQRVSTYTLVTNGHLQPNMPCSLHQSHPPLLFPFPSTKAASISVSQAFFWMVDRLSTKRYQSPTPDKGYDDQEILARRVAAPTRSWSIRSDENHLDGSKPTKKYLALSSPGSGLRLRTRRQI
jgi:hypothetical protein